MLQFKDKKVLVTGGSRGIGEAIAVAFARSGARVAINYRSNEKAAAGCVRKLTGKGHIALRADIADPAQAASLVEKAIDGLGGLNIVVNNAGIWLSHPIASVTYGEWNEAWRQTIDTNLMAVASICYCASQHMLRNGGGRIVNVSSRGAFRGEPDGPAYGASKAGLNSLSQSLAVALAPHNIFVGVVAPGFVETEMAAEWLDGKLGDSIRAQSPLGRVARPDEVAHAVLFLASEGAEFTTGTIIDVNGASYLRS